MALVIGPLGIMSNLSKGHIDTATWDERCIYIRRRGQSVTMSVIFDRLTGPAIAAALYELGDMRPNKTYLITGANRKVEVLVGFEAAFHRLCEVFANASIHEECQVMSWLPGSIPSCLQV